MAAKKIGEMSTRGDNSAVTDRYFPDTERSQDGDSEVLLRLPGRSDVMQSTIMSGIDRSIQNANIADREKSLVSLRDRKRDLGERLSKLSSEQDNLTQQKEMLKCQEEQLRFQEEQLRFQEEQLRFQEEQLRFQEEQLRFQEEQLRFQEEQLRFQEEQLRFQEEQLRVEVDHLTVENDQLVFEENVLLTEISRSELERSVLDLFHETCAGLSAGNRAQSLFENSRETVQVLPNRKDKTSPLTGDNVATVGQTPHW